MIRPILTCSHPDLRTPTIPADPHDPSLTELIREMRSTMIAADGVGLAAPQIGDRRRVIIYDIADHARVHRSGVLLNPVIAFCAGGRESDDEGCLSVPGHHARLSRPKRLTVTGMNENRDPVLLEASGWWARVLAHELEHLDGVLYTDHLPAATAAAIVRDVNNRWGPRGHSWLPGVDADPFR